MRAFIWNDTPHWVARASPAGRLRIAIRISSAIFAWRGLSTDFDKEAHRIGVCLDHYRVPVGWDYGQPAALPDSERAPDALVAT